MVYFHYPIVTNCISSLSNGSQLYVIFVYPIVTNGILSAQVLHGGNDSLCMLAGSHLLISERHQSSTSSRPLSSSSPSSQSLITDVIKMFITIVVVINYYFFADQSSSENKRLKVFPTASHHLILEVSKSLISQLG